MDADTGEIKWRQKTSMPVLAGVTATAGGLVFTGDLSGTFMAYDAATGKPLYRHNTGQPIGGGIITYAVNGKQYVAVAAGMSSKIWQTKGAKARVIIYAMP
jgi:alcohol dehydrogenase (cytochrome c)